MFKIPIMLRNISEDETSSSEAFVDLNNIVYIGKRNDNLAEIAFTNGSIITSSEPYDKVLTRLGDKIQFVSVY